MSSEPTLFDSTMYETANEAVLFCKAHLKERGHTRLAKQLESATPVNSAAVGLVAQGILRNMRAQLPGDTGEFVALALSTVERALESEPEPLSACA